jgi:hypothetical protein
LPELQQAAIEARYDGLLAQCQQPTFLTSGEYLREMGGKEVLDALAHHLRGLGASTKINLADELLKSLARIYRPNTLFVPDDFAELAAILATH